jgi:hypothetical protein
MNTVTNNNIEYISSNELFKSAPYYCKVGRTARDLIKKKKINRMQKQQAVGQRKPLMIYTLQFWKT